nr:MAG TPA: hypothetical protein [Caudoviricetes sp.]
MNSKHHYCNNRENIYIHDLRNRTHQIDINNPKHRIIGNIRQKCTGEKHNERKDQR